jgi:CheY-like chemotaxis protein
MIALRSSASEQHPRVPSDASPSTTANLRGVKAIVVDDEPDAREVLARILANNGAALRTAASADEALKLLREDWPDVLVSDIGMPESDGYDLLRQVRLLEQGRSSRLHAIALTAFARSEDRTKAFLSGYLAHVAVHALKPASIRSVSWRTARLVHAILDRASARDPVVER